MGGEVPLSVASIPQDGFVDPGSNDTSIAHALKQA